MCLYNKIRLEKPENVQMWADNTNKCTFVINSGFNLLYKLTVDK